MYIASWNATLLSSIVLIHAFKKITPEPCSNGNPCFILLWRRNGGKGNALKWSIKMQKRKTSDSFPETCSSLIPIKNKNKKGGWIEGMYLFSSPSLPSSKVEMHSGLNAAWVSPHHSRSSAGEIGGSKARGYASQWKQQWTLSQPGCQAQNFVVWRPIGMFTRWTPVQKLGGR